MMKTFVACASVFYLFAPVHAATVHVGNFQDADGTLAIPIQVTGPSSFWAQSYGYGGGTLSNGISIISGGFDPVVSLFMIEEKSSPLIELNDDGTCPPGNGDCLDFSLARPNLDTGSYLLVLSVSPNLPVGQDLAEGYTGGGSFIDIFGFARTTAYAFEYDILPLSPIPAVPEPTKPLLLCAGLLALLAQTTRRRLKTSVEDLGSCTL